MTICNRQASDGNFTLTYDGQTTRVIRYNASAAEVSDALRRLTGIGDVDGTT